MNGSPIRMAGFAAVVAIWASEIAAFEPDKPSIVFILADDLAYGDLGCYGATRIRTPNIDRLAKEGILFTDAHTECSTCTLQPRPKRLTTAGRLPSQREKAIKKTGQAP